jgi:purine-binding chemotaxis protein CheW
VPQTPPFVRGIINLRGQVISVLDLRMRFAMPAVDATDQTCIVVVEVLAHGRRVCIGLVVDRVSEVLNIPGDQIEETPSFGTQVDTTFILGLGKIGKSVKILLDIDKVLTQDQVEQVQDMAQAA